MLQVISQPLATLWRSASYPLGIRDRLEANGATHSLSGKGQTRREEKEARHPEPGGLGSSTGLL